MKKRVIYVYKTWLIFIVLLLGGFVLTYSSGLAADSNLEQYEADNWTSSGYREVTVEDSQVYESELAAECILNTTDLLSHWPLDEPAGATTFVDVVGSINGTCQGDACPTKTFGKVGGAFTFVASEKDVISVPADIDPANTIYDNMANGDFTAGIWVKTTQECAVNDGFTNKVFFGRHSDIGTWSAWWLGCTEPGGVAVFRLRDSTKTYRQLIGTSNITDGQWHYIVGVRDAGSDKNYLYVDGVEEGMLDTPLYSPTGNFSSDMPITIGAYDEPINYYLDGTLDEVVLYDRMMLPGEIGSYYDACEAASAFTYIPIVVR